MITPRPVHRRGYFLGLAAVIVAVAFSMSTACLPVLFNEIAGKLHLDIVQIGVVWGFNSVISIFSIIAAGLLADRFGVRKVLGIVCLFTGVFGALRGLADGFVSLTVTSLLFGIVGETIPVIVIKSASGWFYGRGLGTAQGVITVGIAGGLLVSSMISATVLSPWLGGWERVMFFYGAISIALSVLWFLTVPEPARKEGQAPLPSTSAAIKHVLRRGNVWLIALGMIAFGGSNRGVLGYLPFYLKSSGWAGFAADSALAAHNAAGAIAALPFMLLSDRLRLRKSVLVIGVIVSTVGVGLLGIYTGPVVWLLAVLAGLFRDAIWAVAATMTVETDGIGPVYAGTAVGIFHSFARLGYTFAPPLGNSLAPLGAGLPFISWAVLTLAALPFFLFVRESRAPTRPS